MKISKKREQILRLAIFESFDTIRKEKLGEDTIVPPDLWDNGVKEKYDWLLEVERQLTERIFSTVFYPNIGG